MSHVFNQADLNTQVQALPTEITSKLYACIVGPHYQLFRYSNAAEKLLIALGQYVSTTDTAYDYPNQPEGSTVDQDYVKLYVDDAKLQYFENLTSGDSIKAVSGYPNKIKASATNWKTNGASYPRAAALYDRDVTIGDLIDVWIGATSVSTSVIGFEYNQSAAVIAAATSDDNNQSSTVFAASVTQSSGTINQVTAVVDGSSYNGLAAGNVSETYLVEVIQGSTDYDPTTARLKVTSASGNDDVASKTPSDWGVATAIGARGLTLTFDTTGSSSGAVDEFVVGQIWTAVVTQKFDKPAPTSSGTYTGLQSGTYVITVTTGGLWANSPVIQVTTSSGFDTDPSVTLTSGSAKSIGAYGVKIAFSEAGLRKGDKYYIVVTAPQNTNCRTLVLAASLPTALTSGAPDLNVRLYITKDTQVTKNRIGYAPNLNYTISATQITTKSGIILYDSTWKNGTTLLPLTLKGGSLYVEYRALLDELTGAVTVFTTDDMANYTIDKDDPFIYAIYNALLNSNGTSIKGVAVTSDDVAGYTEALDWVLDDDDIWQVVALNTATDVRNLVKTWVHDQSTATSANWKIGWVGLPRTTNTCLDTGHEATVTDDPDTSGTQYTYVQATGATFLTAGVAAGDIFRISYRDDGFGNTVYDSYVVSSVVGEEILKLTSGPSAPIVVAEAYEIWHNYTKTELVNSLTAISAGLNERQFYAIMTDRVTRSYEDYFVAAALAGLRSTLPPHRSLTDIELILESDTDFDNSYFSKSYVDSLIAGGVWVVTKNKREDKLYTVKEVSTTTSTSIDDIEQMSVAIDNMSGYFLQYLVWKTTTGGNATTEMVSNVRQILITGIESLKSNTYITNLGSMITGGAVTSVAVFAATPDRIAANVTLQKPAPFNNLDLTLSSS